MDPEAGGKVVKLYKMHGDQLEEIKNIKTFAVNKIFEIGIPFADIGIKSGDEIHFTVSVKKDGKELESWPKGGVIVFKAPDEEFLSSSWFV